MKEDLLCEEELETVLKGLKDCKALSADSVVNTFFLLNMEDVKLEINY